MTYVVIWCLTTHFAWTLPRSTIYGELKLQKTDMNKHVNSSFLKEYTIKCSKIILTINVAIHLYKKNNKQIFHI